MNNNKYQSVKLHHLRSLLKKANKDQVFLRKLETDTPFLADAIKGYQQYPEEINYVSSLKKKVKANTVLKMIPVSAILLIVILWYFVFFNKEKHDNKQTSSTVDTITMNYSTPLSLEAISCDSFLQLTPKVSKKNQQALEQFENQRTEEELMHIQKKLVLALRTDDTMHENISKYYIKLPTTYLYDLKVVVYNKMKRTKQRINDEGTLSPRYENYESIKTDEKGIQWVILSYMDLLNEAMSKFSNGYYENALNDFHYLLQWNENDLNALFYGGLCYYNLQEYNMALAYFEKILEDNSVNFLQETVWYKALTLLKMNRTEEAEKLLIGIARSNGFYSQKAKTLLQQFKQNK